MPGQHNAKPDATAFFKRLLSAVKKEQNDLDALEVRVEDIEDFDQRVAKRPPTPWGYIVGAVVITMGVIAVCAIVIVALSAHAK